MQIFILAGVALGTLHSSTEGHSSSQGGPLSTTLSPCPLALQVTAAQTVSSPKYYIIPYGFPMICLHLCKQSF